MAENGNAQAQVLQNILLKYNTWVIVLPTIGIEISSSHIQPWKTIRKPDKSM